MPRIRMRIRELGALYAALSVKSFSSGLTEAARAVVVFPSEYATNEQAEQADERIDTLFVSFQHRFGRSPGLPVRSGVDELAQSFRRKLVSPQLALSQTIM